jgi:hypothetical protein
MRIAPLVKVAIMRKLDGEIEITQRQAASHGVSSIVAIQIHALKDGHVTVEAANA